MHSLRKRFRQHETESKQFASSSFNHKCHTDHLSYLPIEIYYHIFDQLDIKTVLKLRLVSKLFRKLIDTARHVWKRTQLRTDLTVSFNLDQFWEFFNSNKPNLNHIVFNCTKVLKKFQDYKLATPPLKKFSITVESINIQSLYVLNIFAKYCHTLNINSFLNSSGTIKSESELENLSQELNEFPDLLSASVNFLVYDRLSQKSFIWNDIYLNGFLEAQLHIVFRNVKNLSLHNYQGSIRTLIRSLRNLKNLERLEIETCLSVNDYPVNKMPDGLLFKSKKKRPALLRALKMNQTTPSVALTLINRLVDPENLEELVVYLEAKSTSNNEAENSLNNLLKYVNFFKNLTNIQTNLFYFINT